MDYIKKLWLGLANREQQQEIKGRQEHKAGVLIPLPPPQQAS